MISSNNSSKPPVWVEGAAREAWTKASKILRGIELTKTLARYQSDPVGFCLDMLKEDFTDEVKQVMTSVASNRVTIARSANAVGKSYSAARVAAWFFKCYPESKIFITAAPPLENLRRILWGHLMSVVRNHPELFLTDEIRSLEIRRHEESFIAGLAIPTSGPPEEREAKFSGKHAPHLLFIVDEGDAVPDEVYKGIESCMSGEDNRLLIMLNPRAAVGPVYEKEASGQARVVKLSAMSHPNVIVGKNVIPGAVTQDTTVRRINTWTRPLHSNEAVDSNCWQVPDFLVGKSAVGLDGEIYAPLEAGWRKITNPSFSYMVLGEYPAQSESQLISMEWIEAARKRWDEYVATYGEQPPKMQPILGLDIAEMGVDSNVMIARYGNFIARPIVWKGVDTDQSAVNALSHYKRLDARIIMVDGMGVGSSVAPSMVRMSRQQGEPIKAVSAKAAKKPVASIKCELGEFFSLRDQLWWAVREWLRTDPNAMLPPDRLLVEDLRTPSFELRESGKIKVIAKEEMRELLRRSPDRGDALCLTFLPLPIAKVVRINTSGRSD